MYGAAVAYAAAVVYFGAGVDGGVVADGASGADVCLWIYFHASAELCAGTDVGEGTDVGVVGYFYTFADEARLLYARGLRLDELSGEVEQLRECHIWVVDADECSLYGVLGHEVAAHEHYRGACGVYIMGILWVGEKCECARGGAFDFGECFDDGIGGSFDGASQMLGYDFGCKLHVVNDGGCGLFVQS